MADGPPPLETDRLRLQPAAAGDVALMQAMDTDPEIMRFIDGKARSKAESAVRLSIYLGYGHGFGAWHAFDRRDDHHVGLFKLGPIDARPEIELGYRLFAADRGQGFASEGGKAVLDYGFDVLKLPLIVGLTDPDNIASQKVLERLGFEKGASKPAYGKPALEIFWYYLRKPQPASS